MPQDDGYFGKEIAATYDDDSAEMFDSAVLEPAVDFLAEIAGNGEPFTSESDKHVSVWEKVAVAVA